MQQIFRPAEHRENARCARPYYVGSIIGEQQIRLKHGGNSSDQRLWLLTYCSILRYVSGGLRKAVDVLRYSPTVYAVYVVTKGFQPNISLPARKL